MRFINFVRCMFFSSLTITIVLAIAPEQSPINDNAPSPDILGSQFKYHGGQIMSGAMGINIYILWYGAFSPLDKATIADFFSSFKKGTIDLQEVPTVREWWKTTQTYKDMNGNSVSKNIRLVGQVSDLNYSLGKNLTMNQIESLVNNQVKNKIFKIDLRAIYYVLTASDVQVEGFCSSRCAARGDEVSVSSTISVILSHVGDASSQCPEKCSGPYASQAPTCTRAFVAPNSIGIDGMLLYIASNLVGAATNPYLSGYFKGETFAPEEAVGICGVNLDDSDTSTKGVPGGLWFDPKSNASYNIEGVNGRKFLLPSIYDFSTRSCMVFS